MLKADNIITSTRNNYESYLTINKLVKKLLSKENCFLSIRIEGEMLWIELSEDVTSIHTFIGSVSDVSSGSSLKIGDLVQLELSDIIDVY